MNPASATACLSGVKTGMAQAVFSEIAEHLNHLATTGTESRIDLRSLPLTQADLDELDELLGAGEVSAQLDVIGPSSVRETSYQGVWWIRHFGANGRVAAEEIAITRLPEILHTHIDDIGQSAERIRQALEPGGIDDSNKEATNG